MRTKTLMMIDAARRTALPDEVIAAWGIDAPRMLMATPAQLVAAPQQLDVVDAAWLAPAVARDDAFYELVAHLQDRRIPALLIDDATPPSLGCQVQDGIFAASADTPNHVIVGLLRVLLTQRQGLRQLEAELQQIRANESGLCTQIHKLDEELRLASQLQREFLPPHLPVVKGLDFRALYRPAGYVSGDIYDVARLDEHHVGILIADAVGHGVPAALMTVFMKKALCTKEIGPRFAGGFRITPPAETLARLNQDMIDHQAGKVRTATAWYGVVDTRDMTLRYARAGHPYPLLLHADGSSRFLEVEGSLLAVFPDEVFEEGFVQLQPGDRLLLYSDGFEYAFQELTGEVAQRQHLANTLYQDEFRQLAQGPLDQALTRMIAKLDQQAGSLNQIDDLTVVCMAVDPLPCEAAAATCVGTATSCDATPTSCDDKGDALRHADEAQPVDAV